MKSEAFNTMTRQLRECEESEREKKQTDAVMYEQKRQHKEQYEKQHKEQCEKEL